MTPRLPGLDDAGRWEIPARLNIARQVAGQADALAIVDLTGGDRRDISHGELHHMAQGLARALAARGVGRGDLVGVLLGQTPWCAAAHVAIWTLGAVSVPLFKLFQRDALATRVRAAGISLVLTDAEGATLLGDLATPLLAETEGQAGAPVEIADTGAEDPAFLIFTSGTTGAPKGALHAHRALTGHLPGVSLSHDILGQPGDTLWTPADWAWIGGLFDVLMPGLALGVPVVAGRMAKFSPEGCARIIRTGGVRNVFFPPTALRMLKAAGAHLPDLRSVASGGEPLGAEMLDWGRKAFGLTINEFYGQTECNMVASSAGTLYPPRPGCIGRAVPGHELAVLDEDGAELGEGEEGEIAVKRGSASMMLGYLGDAAATAGKYRGDWMLTGDRGRWDGEYLRFVGRDDDVITSAGYRIGPSEIEDCLMTHPAVATAGVVGKPDPVRTEIVKAYVVLRPGAVAGAADLTAHVRDRLAQHAYPREIEFVDALPMTVTGKIIRKELRARARAEAMGTKA